MIPENNKVVFTKSLGRLRVTLTATRYPGEPLLDTEVKIEGGCLCCISLPDADNFFNELNDVIAKYEI
jgi:hypothetical protein